MVPARNLVRRHCDTFGGAFTFLDAAGEDDDGNRGGLLFDDISSNKSSRRSSSNYPSILNTAYYAMDEKPSRTAVVPGAEEGEEEEEEAAAAAGTSDGGGSKNWLQLGLGTPPSSAASTAGAARDRLMELELFSDRPSSSLAAVSMNLDSGGGIVPPPMGMMPAMMLRPTPHGLSYYRRDVPLPWGAGWNPRPNFMPGGATSSMPPPTPQPMGMPDFLVRQFMFPPSGGFVPTSSAADAVGFASSMRVIKPPTRVQSGVWFLLQAAQHQAREPFLPQIPRSYLRIKDGRMTVRLLMKYLVNKLSLEDESQVEITCRGQLLLPFLTLQHVRDNIWCLRESMALFEDSQSTDHIMTLQYSRSA